MHGIRYRRFGKMPLDMLFSTGTLEKDREITSTGYPIDMLHIYSFYDVNVFYLKMYRCELSFLSFSTSPQFLQIDSNWMGRFLLFSTIDPVGYRP